MNKKFLVVQEKIRKSNIPLLKKGVCSAPSNIALIKYWGKYADSTQIPLNSSISMLLGSFRSVTKISLGTSISGFLLNNKETEIPNKMHIFMQKIFNECCIETGYFIESKNNFPTACGIASSASGYAALVGSIANALQLEKYLSEEELSLWLCEWARLGSGSATRSALLNAKNQFVMWELLNNKETETKSVSVHETFANLEHCVIVFNDLPKNISSSKGHKLASSSILNSIRVADIPWKMESFINALKNGDFNIIRLLAEADAILMHSIMLTSSTVIQYFNNQNVNFIESFIKYRNSLKIPAFWTMDAGPNVHIIFFSEAKGLIKSFLKNNLKSPCSVYFNNSKTGILIGSAETEALVKEEF